MRRTSRTSARDPLEGTVLHRAGSRSFVVEIAIVTSAHTDTGIGLVIAAAPLVLLVPTHLCSGLASEDVESVLVDGVNLGFPQVLHSPSASLDQLSVLRFSIDASGSVRPCPLPRKSAQLKPGSPISLVQPEKQLNGRLVGSMLDDETQWLHTDIGIEKGASGTPLFGRKGLAGICQAKSRATANGQGVGIATKLSDATLRELRALTGRWDRRRLRTVLRYGAVTLLILATVFAALLAGRVIRLPAWDSLWNPSTDAMPAGIVRALYTYGPGAVDPLLMTSQLETLGISVHATSLAPSDLSSYALVVAHLNSPSPDHLEEFLREGGGLVVLAETPLTLGVSDIADWLGADSCIPVPLCTTAYLATDRPFETELQLDDIVAKSSCVTAGAVALDDIRPSAEMVARWNDDQGVFALANTYGSGRVYYQALLSGAYQSEEAWTLLLAGASWASGLLHR